MKITDKSRYTMSFSDLDLGDGFKYERGEIYLKTSREAALSLTTVLSVGFASDDQVCPVNLEIVVTPKAD